MIFGSRGKRDAQEPSQGQVAVKQKKPKSKKKKIIIAVVIALIVGAIIFLFSRCNATMSAAVNAMYETVAVTYGDIESRLSATAPLRPADSYTVSSLMDGTVTEDTFEEGDKVEKDQVLYRLDSTSSSLSVESAQNSLESANEHYNRAVSNQQKLSIKAPVSGAVVAINVKRGDNISAGMEVARVENRAVAELEVQFPSDDASGFYIGQAASVTLDGSFEVLPGTVSHISQQDEVLSGNRIVRAVTIDVSNPGGISTTQAASAQIGNSISSGSANFEFKDSTSVTAEISGKVAELTAKEGDILNSGAQIMRLTSDSLSDSVADAAHSVASAQIGLEQQLELHDKSVFESPIKGTVVEKVAKLGDNVKSGNALCTIYDLSYLTFTMNVDELDIKKIRLGQKVEVTADADEGNTYEGVITRIGINGTTSNGLTTYPVKVEIEDIGGLLPGMNIKAKIVLSSAKNVLLIPSLAVERGNLVLITADSPSAVNAIEDAAPEGFVYVNVLAGISDDTSVEIVEGLVEGDVVAYMPPTAAGLYSGVMF